jgi:nitroreductase
MFLNIKDSNPVLNAIVNRRFDLEPSHGLVSKNLLEILLDSGMRITTSNKNKLWSFVVIQDDDYIQYLKDYADAFNRLHSNNNFLDPDQELGNSQSNSFASLIIVYADINQPFSFNDCWQSIENILLAGSALGLNLSIDTSLLQVLNATKFKNDLSVPEELTVMSAIYVGHHANTYLPASIQKPRIWSWISKN